MKRTAILLIYTLSARVMKRQRTSFGWIFPRHHFGDLWAHRYRAAQYGAALAREGFGTGSAIRCEQDTSRGSRGCRMSTSLSSQIGKRGHFAPRIRFRKHREVRGSSLSEMRNTGSILLQEKDRSRVMRANAHQD